MIIAFNGDAGSGKSTAAKKLAERGYARTRMAEGLKLMLRALLSYQGLDETTIDRMIEGDLKEVPSPYLQGRTPRYAMQTLGHEWGRVLIGDKLWTDAWHNKVESLKRQGHEVFTVEDVRYPDEGDAVHERDGYVVRLEPAAGTAQAEAARKARESAAGHASEGQEVRWDALITNDYTERFYDQLDTVVGILDGSREPVTYKILDPTA